MVGHVQPDTDHPRSGDDGDVSVTGKQPPVDGVMTDVEEAIDADATDAKQRHNAAGDTETCTYCAEPLTTVVKQRRTKNRT